MTLYFDPVNKGLFETYKVQTCSGQPLEVTTASGTQQDAFARTRVATPTTIFDSQHRYQENEKWSNLISGSASTSYNADQSAVHLTVTTASGDYVCRETKKVFPYQPGKSLLVISSFVFAEEQTNLRQRIGYFNTDNGIFLELKDDELYFVLRSKSSGSIVETRVKQSEWNGDKLDGTGNSGLTVDSSKANIFWADLEWLGVGDVRLGFIINGKLILCHTFFNSNKNTTTYMTTAVLPLRQEIETLGTIASGATSKQSCNTVISEGGHEPNGITYAVDNGTTAVSLSSAGTTYPVISIRLNSARLDSVNILQNIRGVVTSNSNVRWALYKNATLAGESFTTHERGNIDFDVTATGISGGIEEAAGYLEKGGNVSLAGLSDYTYQLGRTVSGVSDVFTLAAEPTSNNTNVLFSLQWTEIV
tara:strand:+ start:289 stop:1545 length:1257 start_codon:yes stop_codon:yes gene_type:complete